MHYEWILFDADNTLFDYERSADDALQSTFDQHGLTYSPDHKARYAAINQRYWQRFEQGKIAQAQLRVERFAELLAAINAPTNPQDFSRSYELNLGEGTHLLDGADDLLDHLAHRTQLLLITNGLANVQRSRISKSTIQDKFRDIVISEEVGAAKPDPAIFDIAFSRMGDPAKPSVLIVGDSLNSDIRGGRDYGIDTCWFNPTRQPQNPQIQATFEVASLPELRRKLA